MGALVVAGCVAAAVGAGLLLQKGARAEEQRQREVLDQVAQRRGGRVTRRPRARTLGTDLCVEVPVGDAIVRLSFELLGQEPVTRAAARFVISGGPVFDVVPVGFAEVLARWAGSQDLKLGVREFDGAFLVRGDSHQGLLATWTPRVQHRVVRDLGRARVTSHGREVTLTLPGYMPPTKTLDAMLDVVGELASVGAAQLTGLARLPEVRVTAASGPWEARQPPLLHVATPSGDVCARLYWSEAGPQLWMTLTQATGLPTARARIHDGQAAGLPSELIPDNASAAFQALDGAQLLASPSLVELRWPLVPSERAFAYGVAFLAELSRRAGRAGVYR